VREMNEHELSAAGEYHKQKILEVLEKSGETTLPRLSAELNEPQSTIWNWIKCFEGMGLLKTEKKRENLIGRRILVISNKESPDRGLLPSECYMRR